MHSRDVHAIRPDTGQQAAAEAGRAVVDGPWRQLTAAANRAFAAGELLEAERLYRSASLEAEHIFALEQDIAAVRCIGPMLLTISAHNLAEHAHVAGAHERALTLLIAAFERLEHIARTDALSTALRASAARSLPLALAELVPALDSAAESGGSEHFVARAHAAALAVSRATRIEDF